MAEGQTLKTASATLIDLLASFDRRPARPAIKGNEDVEHVKVLRGKLRTVITQGLEQRLLTKKLTKDLIIYENLSFLCNASSSGGISAEKTELGRPTCK